MAKQSDNERNGSSSSLKIKRLINSKTKGVGETNNVIAKLFRIIMSDIGMTLGQFDILKRKWLNNPNYHIRNSRRDKATTNSNLIKDVIKNTMSIDVFLKLMLIFQVESISFTVTIKQKNRLRPTEHSVEIDDLPGFISSHKTSKVPEEGVNRDEIIAKRKTSFNSKGKTIEELAEDFEKEVLDIVLRLNP